MVLSRIIDGQTSSTWDFEQGTQFRGGIDFTIGDGASLGLIVAVGSTDASYTRSLPDFDAETCVQTCDVSLDVRSLSLQIHVGDRPGFHGILDASVGILSLGNFREESGAKIGPESPDLDILFTLGFGGGYSVSRRLQLTLVQDVGFNIHDKSGTTANSSGGLRPMLLTRFGLRVGVGR
jgi:hypothetical protein